jgi:hypothetical protein
VNCGCVGALRTKKSPVFSAKALQLYYSRMFFPTLQSGNWLRLFGGASCEELNTMKMILRNMLLAACVTSLTTSLRAQSAENSRASSSKQEESTGDADARKKEIQQGTNATGAEKDPVLESSLASCETAIGDA